MEINLIDNIDFAQLLQKINRILSENEKIVVREVPSFEPVMGFSIPEKNSIQINFDSLFTLSKKNIISYLVLVKGINYHELGHIIFNDTTSWEITNFISIKQKTQNIFKQEFLNILNLLDDLRVENLFTKLYDRARHYFTYTATEIIYKDKKIPQENKYSLFKYLLLYGRKFMGLDLTRYRSELKISNEVISSAEKISDDYITEININSRLKLALDLYNLMIKENQFGPPYPINSLSVSSKSNERFDNYKLKEIIDLLKEDIENLKRNNSFGLGKTIEEISEEQLIDVKEEVERDLGSLGSSQNLGAFDGQRFSPSSIDKMEAKKIEDVLRLLRGDLYFKSEKFQKRGKLDIGSALKSERDNTLRIFKKNQLNSINKSRLGASILLDSSGSITNHEFDIELKASWCLAEAFEKLGNKLEVLEFSNYHRVLKTFNNKGDWKRTYDEGTNVFEAINESVKDLIKLKKKENINNLFMIIVSDGVFANLPSTIEKFQGVRKKGIKLIWIFCNKGSSFTRINPNMNLIIKEVDWYIDLNDINNLSIELKKIIKNIELEIIRKVKERY